jgi:hypothetical protein
VVIFLKVTKLSIFFSHCRALIWWNDLQTVLFLIRNLDFKLYWLKLWVFIIYCAFEWLRLIQSLVWVILGKFIEFLLSTLFRNTLTHEITFTDISPQLLPLQIISTELHLPFTSFLLHHPCHLDCLPNHFHKMSPILSTKDLKIVFVVWLWCWLIWLVEEFTRLAHNFCGLLALFRLKLDCFVDLSDLF